LGVYGNGDIAPYAEKIAALTNVHCENRWIMDDEIPDIFNDAAVVVLPYIEASQSGIIPIAYSLAIPVVATPVGGLQEQVIDGETGLIAKNITPEGIADCIELLCMNKVLYYKCREGARQFAAEQMSWEKTADDFLDFITAL